MTYTPLQVERLNAIAHQYRELVYRSIHAVLQQPRYRNTGAGAASLTVDVVEGNANQSPQLQINFADHLLFADKRKMMWTRIPDMRALQEWAETKKPNKQEAKALAWGTAIKQRKWNQWKAKPSWRRRGLSKVLKEMNELIVEAFNKAIEEDIVQEFNTHYNG